MQKKIVLTLLTVVLGTLLRTTDFSVGPMFWEQSSFRDFLQGKVSGCSIAHEGRIKLAPEVKAIYSTDQVMIWAMVTDAQGNLYLGTGHAGKVYKVDANNQGKLFYTAKELDVFALAVDANNNLYVGTSPDGKVYKVAPDGTANEFFNPHAKYIWSLAFDHEGNLFVGTGNQGRIFKVDPAGKGDLFYETKQTHVMAMRLDSKNNLLAGCYPEGILFRISPAGKGFVLYDAPLQEVHSIALGKDGSVYLACINEKVQRRMGPVMMPQAVPAETPQQGGLTITVAEPSPTTAAEVRTEPSFQAPAFPVVGAGAMVSAIYRVAPDLSVETLWSSREETVYDVLALDDRLLFSTDAKGRVYELYLDRRYSLLAETNEAQASRLLRRGEDVIVATSNVGKIFQLGSNSLSVGTVESSIKDTQLISKWGIISWQGESPAGTSIRFFTRTGNSDKPDSAWSDWSAAYTHPDGEQITSPSARFIQWKTELKGTTQASPWIDSVTVAYLPQNVRPEITSVTVTPQGLSTARHAPLDLGTPGGPDSEGKSNVATTDASGVVTVTAFPSAVPSRNRVTVNWQAEDKNHDSLEYAIYIRGVKESEWRLLKKDIRETSFTLDPETLPDGKYRIRVVASDAPSNPSDQALSSERESEVFLIDNTPPKVELTGQTTEGNTAIIHFRASDSESTLRRAEYSVDGGKWKMIESDDGIVDSMFEEFTVRAENLPPGEHVVTLRTYDASGNPGLAKAVVNITKK